MAVQSLGISDVGRFRPHNEDSFLADDDLGLYIVADGVGGNAKGEVASAESVDLVHSWVRRWRSTVDACRSSPTEDNRALTRRLLESAVQSACYMVFGMGELDPEQRGMSTTLSSLLVIEPIAYIAQVGDSRVYRMRESQAVQLTEDHTLINYKLKHGLITAEEAARAPGKNVITRAVGHRDYVEVDTLEVEALAGDRFMLCSDGLHGYLLDGELDTLLRGDRPAACQRLVALANARGGRDNITVVTVDIE
jgi:serine/threonine protein phosphatase PrpC